MGRKMVVYKIILILALIGAFAGSSCDAFANYKIQTLGTGYTLFTLKKGIGHFSLEYPERYGIGIVDPRNDSEHVYTTATFRWVPPRDKNNYRTSSDIFVDIYPKTATNTDGQRSLEVSLEIASKNHFEDYRFIERFEVTIAGEHGYGAAYSWVAQPGVPNIPLKQVTTREVDFEVNGLIWTIQISADSSTSESDKVDFDHILQTVKILN